jgi:hypothetical protein
MASLGHGKYVVIWFPLEVLREATSDLFFNVKLNLVRCCFRIVPNETPVATFFGVFLREIGLPFSTLIRDEVTMTLSDGIIRRNVSFSQRVLNRTSIPLICTPLIKEAAIETMATPLGTFLRRSSYYHDRWPDSHAFYVM